ncbi:type IV secretion system DNA-binding domain-containing protein, partial [Patescibacteria group bacterium]|nr:type IV secretion system DNA-binding domain-containing protein [Patescibacteria group bacterium]
MSYDEQHENEIIVFAETNFRNSRQKFGIKTDDRRRHVYVLGKTGMGKTTLLENMILEDIYAGHGVAFVDPHGDSSEKILNYIPSHRLNDVVYFNPADVENPVGFNILETVDETHKHLVASGLMGVFKKIWPDVWSARMEYILNNAVLALLDVPGSTLLGIMRLLSEKDYRKKVISQVKDPVVKAFWTKEFAQYKEKFATEAIAPIQNKVGQFLSAFIIRNIVAQVKSTIDVRRIMDEGKIFIMNLSKGKIGEDSSHLLGGMLITKIQLSAMERVDTKEEDRRDFYLYVDEFQNFANESFADILSEARKYKLNLILAHQYIAQLDEASGTHKVRDAIFGNVGTHIVFRVGAADAVAFEEEFAPVFVPEDLVNLPKFNIYLKLMIDGAASQPFSATALPPIGSPTGSYEKAISISRERYAQKRSVIEEKIERWWGLDDEEGPPPNLPSPSRSFPPGWSPRAGSRAGGPSTEGGRRSSFSPPLYSRGELEGGFRPPRQTFPATCSRCGRETTSGFKPDPRKPFYCEDCLPIMREKLRRQSEGPRSSSPSLRGGTPTRQSHRSKFPPSEKGEQGGFNNNQS